MTFEKVIEAYCYAFITVLVYQATTTATVYVLIYWAPHNVHKFLFDEPHWQRSRRDSLYMYRLFAVQFSSLVLAPIAFYLAYSWDSQYTW